MSIGYSLDRVLVVVVCAVLFSCAAIHAKECGTRPRKMGITNGTNAYENEFPWQVSFVFYDEKDEFHQHHCGGTILAENLVISAASCFDPFNMNDFKESKFRAIVGMYKISKSSKNEKTIELKKIHIHPNWNATTSEHDLALVELAQPIGLDSGELNAICLNKNEPKMEGKSAVVTGWGDFAKNSRVVIDALQKATVTVESLAKCKASYSKVKEFHVNDGNVCAGRERGTCYGDTGGPLQYELNGRWYLLGVASRIYDCGSSKYPSVYTQIKSNLDFIERILKSNNSTKIDDFFDDDDDSFDDDEVEFPVISTSKNVLINTIVNVIVDSVNFVKNNTYSLP